ncbi:MAG: hypothetical protein Q9171_003235 [Xanthocarpia ochracea]
MAFAVVALIVRALTPSVMFKEWQYPQSRPLGCLQNLIGCHLNHACLMTEISHIRILPTTDEILCQKRQYMPPKDAQDGNHERRGKLRMLDVQFRHLRFDTLEPVIDACYHASQHLATTFGEPAPLDYEARQHTARGTQYSLFQDVQLEDLRFETEGIHLRLSFACPARLRQRRMLSSGHLESGMLMALIGLDSDNTLFTAFLMVEMCQSTLSMKPTTGNHLRASVVASFVEPSDTNTIRQTLYGLQGLLNKEKHIIVEFPKVLVAGFYWILKHLQFLSSSNTEIAFSDLIAPSQTLRTESIAAPAYSNSSSSSFDLSVLQVVEKLNTHTSLQIEPNFMALEPAKQRTIIEDVCSTTSLDHGQATALCENLSRGLAFTQGPPGTGKTFLGVSLAKVILKHTPQKPILVACMTNHALDNFLSDLLKQGITKIARIGNGSKEEWTDKYTLPSLRKTLEKGEKSLSQKTKEGRAYTAVQALWAQGTTWCESLNSRGLTWSAVADHLKSKYPNLHSDFSRYESPRGQKVSDIRQGRSEAGGYAFEHWSSGKDLKDTEEFSRDVESFFNNNTTDIQSADGSSDSESSSLDLSLQPPHIPVVYPYDDMGHDVWSMPMDVRAAWTTRWKSELGSSSPIDKLVEIQRRYLEAKRIKQETFSRKDAELLANQEVIGLTTTACAKFWAMLKSLDLETLICEEAGEVSEAQTITTLFPSIKHAIFIGDPLQLRPQVNQPSLSVANTYGAKYRLDESLFERMVMPLTSGEQSLPASKLDLQRRMHPDVAQLLRATLYPYLKDHPSTSHLPVAGMAHRTFWLDHQEPEDVPNQFVPSSKSYSNAFECAMICELVRYLLNTNDFGSGDIAILVPYSQQLACLKEKLSGTRACSIALSEKDKEDLVDMGLLDESELSQFRSDVKVSPMVRLATIDGFQGEEAKVIILSTVRSNLQHRVGFLQTTNRINVACSRARNGFYIIGNSTLLRKSDMWATIIADFEAKRRLGTSFTTHCSPAGIAAQKRVMNQYYMIGCAISFMNAVIDAAANAPNARKTTSTANVKGYAPNGTLVAMTARLSVILAPVRRADYLASDLVSMVEYAESLVGSTATRQLPSKAMIFLPCGHNFNVADLDAQFELGNIFDVGTFGEVLAMQHTVPGGCKKTPQCPKCGAACDSVPRYRHSGQFRVASDTIERLYKMLGRKMRMFARNIQDYRKNLQKGFEWFCDNFEPGPLTDEVLLSVEKDMARTALWLGNEYASAPISLSFKARFDLLYLHCRLTVLQESARIVQFLRGFDSSRHTEYMVKELKRLTIQQVDENIAKAEELVEHCRLNSLLRLEAETTLVQLCFDAVAENLGSIGDSLERHERVEMLMTENPDTAGVFKHCYHFLDPEAKDSDSTAELWTAQTREFWEKWGEYEIGSLAYCKNGHPYSRKTFPECAECGGRRIQREQIEDGEAFVKNLDREMFLKAIAKLSKQR